MKMTDKIFLSGITPSLLNFTGQLKSVLYLILTFNFLTVRTYVRIILFKSMKSKKFKCTPCTGQNFKII